LLLGQLQIELGGLDRERADLLFERYTPYSGRGIADEGALRVRVGIEDREYFIDPPRGTEFTRVHIEQEGDRVRYLSYRVAGWFDTATRRGQLLLARGGWEPELRAFENYVRVAVAWMAASLGGALVHAAGAEWRGNGYLFYGESGAGKSTLAASNRRARFVSDDLSLVLPGDDGRLELVGSPFRGTYEGGAPVEGRFPLRAGFRLIQAAEAGVRKVGRVQALSELVGNLPFVAEAFSNRPDLFARVEGGFAPVPLFHLEFRKDDTFWDAIDAAGLTGAPA
jgi:hypothetical protein